MAVARALPMKLMQAISHRISFDFSIEIPFFAFSLTVHVPGVAVPVQSQPTSAENVCRRMLLSVLSTHRNASARTPLATHISQNLEHVRQLHRQGDLDKAMELYQDLLQSHPEIPEAWQLSGVVLLQRGDTAAAIENFKLAILLAPEVAGYHRNLAEALQVSGDLRAALLSLEHSLGIDPLQPDAWAGMCDILLQLNEATAAYDCLKLALDQNPHHVPSRLLLANAQLEMNDLAAAESNYLFVLRQNPENVIAIVNLATILRARGESVAALELLRPLLVSGTRSPLITYNFANALVDVGEFVEARQHYQSALFEHPQPAKVLFNLSSITRFQEADLPQLNAWAAHAESRISSVDEAVYLHFALGKAHNDLGNYKTAFQHFQKGNHAVPTQFEPAVHREEITRTISTWSSEFTQTRARWGCETAAPVFIVGMPRSGTTLVEQILAAHSAVDPHGERDQMQRALLEFADSIGCEQDLTAAAERSTQADFHALANSYLHDVPLRPGKIRMTDKMPTNFLLLGWIATCFPEATIIHCLRDPRDVCLSCYFQHFTARLPFTYRLDHLIEYYRDYERLMSHWHSLWPGRILDVQYEELVASPEAISRKIIDHAGLGWETGCLSPHAVRRAIRTASGWQVRQPIYTTSEQRWRKYEQDIPELLQEFGDQQSPRASTGISI